MNHGISSSEAISRLDWGEAKSQATVYGPKGALLLSLPRSWVPPFILLSDTLVEWLLLTHENISEVIRHEQVKSLLCNCNKIIVRSSVIDETIWERGTFRSEIVDCLNDDSFGERLLCAVSSVRQSAPSRRVGMIIQKYVEPRFRGEFGNLLRVSKTRDHWEVSSVSTSGIAQRERINCQRDIAADDSFELGRHIRPTDPRSFGAIASWINSQLLSQAQQRVNVEWVYGEGGFFVVQIDEETEDFTGVNPFQLRFPTVHSGRANSGRFILAPTAELIGKWDKLAVLEDLWAPGETQKPMLFSVSPNALSPNSPEICAALESEFSSIVGPDKIILRTSIKRGREKITNLPRSEGLTPAQAAQWCIDKTQQILSEGILSIDDFSFVTHRLIPSRASAWALARFQTH